tara:strand:- start:151 stop:822 length:672 start_codon:yes stop_codon:yes gene_type:complete
MISVPKNIVVISPHPDDETLGAGATIAKFTNLGSKVSILVVSGHLPPLYNAKDFKTTKSEAIEAFNILGVNDWKFLEIPATMVHVTPIAELNQKISNFIETKKPELVLIPFPDRHIDHRTIFDSCVVCCRPISIDSPKMVLAYETLSETHWNVPGIEANFVPEFYVDVSKSFDKKINALDKYKSQIKNNKSRSVEACKSLAHFRGSQNGCKLAEAFKVIRIVI